MYSATLSGATYVPAHCGQGLSFDGVDDFVEVSPSLDMVNDYTITAWINSNAQNNAMGILSTREQCSSSYRGYSLGEFGLRNYAVNPLSWQLNAHQNCTGFSGGDRYINAGLNVPNNVQTFVAVTVQNNNSENRTVQLYLNCEEFSTTMTLDMTTAPNFSNAANYITTIGAFSNVPGFYNTFDGIIDEVRLYDTALDHEAILDIYQSCLPPEVDMVSFPNCATDSAVITVNNTELDVEYQLFDLTNGVYVGPAQLGGCNSLVFSTGAVTSATQFQLEAINTVSNCAIWMDSIFTLDPTAQQFTGSQSVQLCAGDSILINNQYVTSAGTYNDTIPFSAFCDSIITYTVSLDALPQPDLGPDFDICQNESQTLNANNTSGSNVWQDGSTGSSITISQPGTYWVTTTNQCGSITDSIFVGLTDIGLDLGNDVSFCEGNSVVLQVNFPPADVTWQDGSSGDSYLVSNEGLYIAEVTQNNCTVSDSIYVTVNDIPQLFLGLDTIMCDGDNFLLSAGSDGTYSWNTGSSEPTIVVSGPGNYSVTVTNECGTASDDINVTSEECFCQMYVPNAFTPNGDEHNNAFFAVFDCPVQSFELLVFNRWGEVVFESNDLYQKWDGFYKGALVQDGLYSYKITYAEADYVPNEIFGHVNIIR